MITRFVRCVIFVATADISGSYFVMVIGKRMATKSVSKSFIEFEVRYGERKPEFTQPASSFLEFSFEPLFCSYFSGDLSLTVLIKFVLIKKSVLLNNNIIINFLGYIG